MSVPRGHVFGLLGPNGSGKTTTMSMLLGLVRPTAGGFNLFGSSDGLEEALHRVGAIIESPTFYPYLTGRQNLLYFQGISGRGASQDIDGLLERVGLEGRGDHRFRTYSLGMKQRLGLAYSLLGDPELLFLDEPTNGMDPAGMAEVRDLICSLGTGGRTVLLSSHLLHEVEQVCDSVAILSKGKLIAQGDVADLLRSQDQIRIKTTDNAKAVEVLSALDWLEEVKPVFPILGVFRLNGQPKRDDGMIFGSCKARQSPVYPIRDAFLAVNHASCPSLSSSGPRQWGESALKTSRLPGALSLLAKSWLYPPSAWRRR